MKTEIEKIRDLAKSLLPKEIEGILAGGMTNAVMGLIEGTKTLGTVLADIARQLASMFLNKAFRAYFSNMAKQRWKLVA